MVRRKFLSQTSLSIFPVDHKHNLISLYLVRELFAVYSLKFMIILIYDGPITSSKMCEIPLDIITLFHEKISGHVITLRDWMPIANLKIVDGDKIRDNFFRYNIVVHNVYKKEIGINI